MRVWYLPLTLWWAIKRAAVSSSQFTPICIHDFPHTSNHVGSHAITNEHDDVLCLVRHLDIADSPIGLSDTAIRVAQCSDIIARLIQRNLSISLGSHFDHRRGMRCLGKQVLIPSEVPPLNCWLSSFEESSRILWGSVVFSFFCNGKGELLVGGQIAGNDFTAVLRCVGFESNVEPLAR